MSKEKKYNRLKAALNCEMGDQVAISDFFWTSFMKNARIEWGQDVDIYRKLDLDYIVCNPNMDPVVKDFEILKEEGEDCLIKTGFGAKVLRRGDLAMPHFEEFSIKSPEDMETFVFESPSDDSRFYRTGDDQINGLGDAIVRNTPAWIDRVNSYVDDFPVFGSVCEGYEYVWRCMGTENALYWMMLEPEKFKEFMQRVGDFLVELAEAQIKVAGGKLSGMYIWGDVAYVNAMLFSPEIWREIFKPILKRIIEVCRKADLLVIYHGCGDATKIYEDFIEAGVMGYHPLEVKANLDGVILKETFENRLAFVGNVDVRELESGDKDRIKKEVLYKLQIAQDGGYICQSDHSVSGDVAPQSYAYMVELVREYGKLPLDTERIKKELENLQ